MFTWIFTFLSVFIINVAYTYYLKAVQKEKPLLASSWSMFINLTASVVAIEYIANHWLLIPSCLGSFCGTWVGMKVAREKSE